MGRDVMQAKARLTTRRGKRRRAAGVEYQSYGFCIASWEPSYSLAVGQRAIEGPYWEHAQIVLTCHCLGPAILKGRNMTMTLMGDRRQPHRPEYVPADWLPLCVGTLTKRGEQLEYFGSVPFDGLWGLVAALGVSAVDHIILHGERMRRGTARILSLRLARDFDPEEIE